MIKNKLLLAALFSLSLVLFNTTQAKIDFSAKPKTVDPMEEIFNSLGSSKVEYIGGNICIYPDLHTLRTLFASIGISGAGIIWAMYIIGSSIKSNGKIKYPEATATIALAPFSLGFLMFCKAIKDRILECSPIIIINNNGITYHGRVLGEPRTTHLSWDDIEKVIAQPGYTRDVAVLAKESCNSFFVPEYNLPISYEEFSKIAARYSWLAWADAEKTKNIMARASTSNTPSSDTK